MTTQDGISDNFLLTLRDISHRVNIPGHFILEVWNSESGITATNPKNGLDFYGPAEIMGESLHNQGVDLNQFQNYNVEQRLPYMEPLLKYQSQVNGHVAPDRPEVLYAINFLPAPMMHAGPNPSGDTLLAPKGSTFWNYNPLFHRWDNSAGTTVHSMRGRLDDLWNNDARLHRILNRYTALTGIAQPDRNGGGSLLGKLFKGILLGVAGVLT